MHEGPVPCERHEPDAKLEAWREIRAALGVALKKATAVALRPVQWHVLLEVASAVRPSLRCTAGKLAAHVATAALHAGIRNDLRTRGRGRRLAPLRSHEREGDKLVKAFMLDRYGKTARLRMGELPEPVVGEADVLVEVHAAGVNVLDSRIRNGEFKFLLPYRLPLVLGNDVAGVVVRVGANVRRFKAGDEVYARPDSARMGAFAERVAMTESAVALKPRSLGMEEAASLPLVALTAWQVLVERAQVKKGQKVFIHAGSGGVGTIAIQLAKHLGAFVATTTSAANADWVKRLGADVVIDYGKEDFEQVLHGYDVVLNSLGADVLEKSLRVLKPGGQLISISGPPDPAFAKESGASWPLRQVMRLLSWRIRKQARRRGVGYSFLLMRASGDQLREIAALVDAAILRPVVDQVFPFAATNDAMAYVDKGRAKGKVVVRVK